MKKKIITIIAIVVVIIGVIILSMILLKEKPNKSNENNLKVEEPVVESTPENTKEHLQQLLEKDLVDKNITKDKMEQILGVSISSQMIVLGKDSYIMDHPEAELIEKYNLSDLVKKQEEYAKRIQDEFLKEFKYEFADVTEFEDQIHQNVKITAFYYGLYLNDLDELTQYIYQLKNYQISVDFLTEQNIIQGYKYQVLAMEILDKNFDVYKNVTDESLVVDIIYRKNKPATSDELFSLLCNMLGITYKNAGIDGANSKERQERMENYKQQVREMI